MKQSLLFFTCLISIITFSSCAWLGSKPMTQAEIKNFETRTVDAPFKEVYAAATEALFDLGYTINHSDKHSGVIVGEKSKKRYWSWADSEKSDKELYDYLQLTILVKRVNSKSSKVRIKTSINKERHFDRRAINEVWVYIERQVLMEGGA